MPKNLSTKDVDGTLHLYCPDGFKFAGENRVFVYLNGCNVSEEVGALVNIHFSENDQSIPTLTQGYDIRHGRHLRLEGAESFTITDLVCSLEEIFALPIIAHNGVPLPYDCQ